MMPPMDDPTMGGSPPPTDAPATPDMGGGDPLDEFVSMLGMPPEAGEELKAALSAYGSGDPSPLAGIVEQAKGMMSAPPADAGAPPPDMEMEDLGSVEDGMDDMYGKAASNAEKKTKKKKVDEVV